jgi:hypothetical protein
MYIKLVILSVVLIALAIIGLGIKMLFRKKEDLSNIHIDNNSRLKDKGIVCPHCKETGQCCGSKHHDH